MECLDARYGDSLTLVAFKKELDKYLEEKSIMGYMMDICNLRMPDTEKSTRMQDSLKEAVLDKSLA